MSTKVAEKAWGYRHVILLVVWALYLINYLDRIAVLTFLPYIQKDLHLTTVQVGWLGSIFFFGYALAQFSAGFLSDKIGAKKTMSIAIFVFTCVTFLTGFVRNFTQFIVLRLGLALGEGHHYTPAIRALADWMPDHEKGRASGFFATVFGFAPMLTPMIVTSIAVAWFGGAWRPVFFCLAVPGVVGILILWKFMHDTPSEALNKGALKQREYDMIVDSIGHDQKITGVNYDTKLIFTDSKFYLYSIAWFMQLMIYWGMTTWVSFFLVTAHGVNIKTMGILAGVPYAAAIVAQFLGGVVADKWFQGRPRIVCVIAFLGCIPSLYFLGQVSAGNITPLVVLLALCGFFINFNWGVIQSYPSYRYPREIVGRAMGIANGVGQFGSFVSPMIASYLIIKTATGANDFSQVFIFWSIAAAVAALAFFFLKEEAIDAEPFKVVSEKKKAA